MKKKGFIEKEKKVIGKEWKNILFNCVLVFLALVFTIWFYKNILLTTILLSILGIVGLLKWKSWVTFIIFIFGALWGPISESIAIKYGVWEYALPSFFNVPAWLFILWGIAAVFLYQTALEFIKLGVKK
jgi:hypothetical protein